MNRAAATPAAVADPAVERAFITRVYGWMAIALAITGLVATATASDPALMAWIFDTPLAVFGIVIVQLIIVVVLSAAVHRLSTGVATGLFIAYAALTGFTFSTLFYVYTAESIGVVFFITAGTFALVSLYGFTTKTDLTRVGNLAFMGLIGILLASLINFFLRSEAIYWIVTYVGVLVFVGLIASNTQRIKRMAYGLGDDGELRSKASVVGALSLYLSFINLFLSLLRIFGNRK
ncbi:MAG: Bax inhibitor-1/YccA family protein [Anaerolineae bacterium]|nr:Bax inhibitor-1/YccA family protein [Candidatus Roseilinea sp.]MDW8448394.1 Bax inhibitor-1/YccA family protein [Anaerolineae bacterium]